MNRRGFLRNVSALAGAAGLSASARAADVKKPNIVFILCDDLGYGDIGCFGQTKIKTPCIDRMAKEGMRLTQFYAGDTVCAPSRCCLMTGYHTGHSYVRGNYEIQPEGQLPLPPGTVTVGHILQKAGYVTGITGKWGLGGPDSTGVPNKMGFDEWFGYLCQRQAHNYYQDHLWKNGERVELDGKTYTHDLFANFALDFIRNHKDDPFFLYVPFTIPHTNFQVPSTELYDDTGWDETLKIQASMISRMDKDVGRILDLLGELGLAENTLVLFSSDNGPHGSGGTGRFFNASGPLRGIKRDMYEGGIRVPTIARWPGVIPPGTESKQVGAFWDLMPTFAELTGAECPEGIDGISLAPTILGHPDQQKQHDYLYWEFWEKGGKQAVLKGDWKAVRLDILKNPDAPLELYNVANDLAEEHNLAGEYPEKAAEFQKIFEEARVPSEHFGRKP